MPTPRDLWAACAATVSLAVPAMAQTTMDELWPNQDGLSWTYAQRYEDFEKPLVVENRTRIFLDGTVTAPTAIQAQYLRQELVSGPAFATSSEPELTDPFLRQLWIARPDLRTKILQFESDADCPETTAPGSYGVFLSGELAYLKTSADIGAWRCNKNDTQAWLWLVSDVSIGSTFTLQLVPDLADNVFLHGEIAATEPVTVPAGTFKNCVRVDYRVDYGLTQCTDDQGNPVGSYRSETLGYVHYAPGVGPVQSLEEFIPVRERIGDCSGPPVGAVAARVTLQMDTTPTPVRRASWGQIKLVYR
jgi:hypothetical protein